MEKPKVTFGKVTIGGEASLLALQIMESIK